MRNIYDLNSTLLLMIRILLLHMHFNTITLRLLQLENPGVQIQSVNIENVEGGGQQNTLNTFWMQSDVDLSRGLDFSNRGPVYARFTHLNHRRFRYV